MSAVTQRVTPAGVERPMGGWEGMRRRAVAEFGRVRFMVASELQGRLFQKTLGLLFLFVEPVLMAFVYFLLTIVILGSRVGKEAFAGIYVSVALWRWFARTLDAAPGIFGAYSSILKQTNFSVFSILLSSVVVELVNMLLGLVVLLAFIILLGFHPRLTWLLLPFVMVVQFTLTLFFALVLSCAGAFIKDIGSVTAQMVGIWFYLSPGIYPVDRVPENYLWLYNMNPFAHILPAYKMILLDGAVPAGWPLLLILLCSIALAGVAFRVLAHARYHFFSYI